jgi:outer membrane protein assembly factor BamB
VRPSGRQTGGVVEYSATSVGPDGTVYAGSWDNFVYALNGTTGALKWRYRTGWYVRSTPTLARAGTLFASGWDGSLYALDSRTGTLKWRYTAGNGLVNSPSLSHDEALVYVGSLDTQLHAVNATSGARVFAFQAGGFVTTSPAVAPNGIIYFGSFNNGMYAVNGRTGALVWRYAIGTEIQSSAAISPQGDLYVGTDAGMYAFSDAACSVADAAWAGTEPRDAGRPRSWSTPSPSDALPAVCADCWPSTSALSARLAQCGKWPNISAEQSWFSGSSPLATR